MYKKLLEKGLFLMPCCSETKTPKWDRNWKNKPYINQKNGSRNSNQIDEWLRTPGTCLGVVGGRKIQDHIGGYLLIVDIDVKEEGTGYEWEAFTSLGTNTNFVVRTPGKERPGQHYYFRTERLFTGRSPAHFVDSRCFHQFVLAPGTTRTDGGIYTMERNGEIGWAPEWLIKACEGPSSQDNTSQLPTQKTDIDWGLYHRLYRAAKYFKLVNEESEKAYKEKTLIPISCFFGPHQEGKNKSAILPPDAGREHGGYRCFAGKCDGKGAKDVMNFVFDSNPKVLLEILSI